MLTTHLYRASGSSRLYGCICALFLLFTGDIASAKYVNGVGSYHALGREQYIAKLSLATPSTESKPLLLQDLPATMELRVATKRIPQRRFVSMWIEAITVNSDSAMVQQHMQELLSFNQLFKGSLYEGDQLVIDYQPQAGMRVILNDVALGEITSGSFFRLLLASWIGPVPISSSFRNQMLSPYAQDETLTQRFSRLSPSQLRASDVAAWNKPAQQQEPTPPVQATSKVAQPVSTQPQQLTAVQSSIVSTTDQHKPEKTKTPRPVAQVKAQSETVVAATPNTTEVQQTNDKSLTTKAEDALFTLSEETLQAQQEYYVQLSNQILKYQALPRQAFQRRLEGDVRVLIKIHRDGKLKSLELAHDSKHKLLNQQALDAVAEAAPFPPVPASLSGEEFAFSVPMNYRLPY